MDRAVLVTGATGFIGRHVVDALQQDKVTIHAVSRAPEEAQQIPGVIWHKADLLDPSVVTELATECSATDLLHLAWITEHGAYWTSEENLRWVEASLRLFREFAHAGGRRIVVAGTCAEYDWSVGGTLREDSLARPSTLYGTSKNVVREILEAWAPSAGLDWAWGRLFWCYGPFEHRERLVPSVVRALLSGVPIETTSGEQSRDFLHVTDVAGALSALVLSDVTGIVNVASGVPRRVREVIEGLAAELGRPDLVRLGARPMGAGEPASLVADVGRLAQDVGWTPEFSLAAGLTDAIAYWRTCACG